MTTEVVVDDLMINGAFRLIRTSYVKDPDGVSMAGDPVFCCDEG
jgi:hypothetical protein